MGKSTYTMNIGLNVLEHLGIGLYSNIPAVLSEAVANAWDADATQVRITTSSHEIVIEDDGVGMSVADANKKYLYVGYDRRKKEGGMSPSGRRPVMGRKGIGKLSLFSIADTVTVHSVKDGRAHGFRMSVEDIRKAASEDRVYHPEGLSLPRDLGCGTRIVLTNLKYSPRKVASLRKKIARRFAVLDDEFKVFVNDEELTAEDRGYQGVLQYAWTLGRRGKSAVPDRREVPGKRHIQVFDLAGKFGGGRGGGRIDGWIGTVGKPRLLKDLDGESNNKIVVMVRGKIAQEDMLGEMGEHGVYSAYLVGEIHADFMDVDNKADAATTGRQHLREDDPRYKALKEKIGLVLKHIEREWTGLRNKEGAPEAFKSPAIKKWYDDLPSNLQEKARTVLGRMNTPRVDNDDERRRLFLAGIIAFEGLRLKNMLEKIDSITVSPVSFDNVFEKVQELEATAHHQITKDRLSVIKKLQNLKDRNGLERVVQKHLFKNLWLLDPSWSYTPSTAVMEKTVKTAIKEVDKGLVEAERRARLDIKYTTVAGKHVIIELKRPSRRIATDSIESQLRKYWRALRKALDSNELEFVCVLGKMPVEWGDSSEAERARRDLESINARIVTYTELIDRAQKAYAAYTENKNRISGIHDLVNAMGKEDREKISPA